MGKPIIVANDKVEGTDKHHVTGQPDNSALPPYTGVGDFEYVGKMTDQLSDFVSIDGKPVALKSSKSALDPGESVAPTGRHSGPRGEHFIPPPPLFASIPSNPQITDPIGEGRPSVTSGSSFVTVNGVAVLLDGDKIDTCDGLSQPMNSTVTAEQQDFVACSE
jgi:uncharacterized Zn-binding protein involved in type VI secretion